MDTTHLGRSGLKVSRICLGTMNFGPETEEPDAHRIMDRAIDAGINFFDTANVYGWGENKGRTETIIGRWLAQGGRRDRVVLATKVYGPMYDGPNGGRLSAYSIRRACDDSLRRLQTDRIDLYQMHHVDRETPWEEIWQAMEILVAQGKVLYVGSSNFAAWNIVQANEAALRRSFLGLVSEQSLYHLGARTIELEVVPACRAYGVGIMPWSPLGGGLLGGALKKAASGRRASERLQKEVEKHRTKLEAYETLCGEMGEKPANVGVAWLLNRPGVTAPIVGPRTIEQLEDALRAEKLKLSADVMGKLDSIWPGPGGQAPEAYAW
ncbi:MAG TPA: aldo/keto reductase [Polyangiaceae bacterium]|nr:aldo/keto reductase [Polyangiaceae bacterium]